MLHRTKIQTICRNSSLLKQHSSTKPKREIPDPIQTICKIMSSTPVAALDHTGVMLTPEIAEHVLARFQNAGLLFQWTAKQRGYSHSRPGPPRGDRIPSQHPTVLAHVSAMRSNDTVNVETFCIIMRQYARARKIDEALYTFKAMQKHDVSQNFGRV